MLGCPHVFVWRRLGTRAWPIVLICTRSSDPLGHMEGTHASGHGQLGSSAARSIEGDRGRSNYGELTAGSPR